MTLEELASELRRSCKRAGVGDKMVTMHLFGIRHARHLGGQDLHELVRKAGLREAYGQEIRKGVRLAEYVRPI